MAGNYDEVFKIAISMIAGIGCVSAKKLVAYTGGVEAVFAEKPAVLRKIPGIGDYLASKITRNRMRAVELAEEELEYIANNEIQYITYWDSDFPSDLIECLDAPLVLYYKGQPQFSNPKKIAVVGTRNSTRWGKEFCDDFISKLAERHPDAVVVSGLAFGIDAAAHNAALRHKLSTWAVVGHGFETIYPAEHAQLAKDIIASAGAVITEYNHNSKIVPANFVERNRIIAGLSKAIIIAESGRKGGAMITADFGNQYNRDVFAVPGRIDTRRGNGCNLLIKSHRAALIESIDDLEYITGWKPRLPKAGQASFELRPETKLSDDETVLVEVLKQDGYSDIDQLMSKTGFQTGRLSCILLELEFKGVVKSLPGKIFALHKA